MHYKLFTGFFISLFFILVASACLGLGIPPLGQSMEPAERQTSPEVRDPDHPSLSNGDPRSAVETASSGETGEIPSDLVPSSVGEVTGESAPTSNSGAALEDKDSTDSAKENLQLSDRGAGDRGNPPVPHSISVPQSPPGSLSTLPGRIEAEDYKTGGAGVAYYDNDAGNKGGEYRADDVDIRSTSDNGGGYRVIRTAGGEWLAFDAHVTQSGTYDIIARVASGSVGTKSFHVEVDGQDVTGAISFDDSQGYNSFVDVLVKGVSLTAGRHEFRFVFHTGYFSINYLDLVLSASVNEFPLVEAGSSQTVTLPENAALKGIINYKGRLNLPEDFLAQWSQVSGAGSVSFADASAVETTATFPHLGEYVLRLTVGDGNRFSSDQLTITVMPAPVPTVVPAPVPDTPTETPPGEEPLEGPWDILVHPTNPFIYVTGARNGLLQVLDLSGALRSEWGSEGSGKGQFNNPSGIAMNPDNGFIYVADTQNHRVQMFNATGGFITQWGGQGSEKGQFNSPRGIAVHPNTGFVYVADTGNHRVQVFNASGGFVTEWGSRGGGKGQFKYPSDIAFEELNGKVYVADTGNNRIQIFLSSGAYDSKWGRKGSEKGRFLSPTGILLHPLNGLVYVSDSENHRIQVFDREGHFWFQWGNEGSSENELRYPRGLAVDPRDGRVYIADSGNRRIQVFSEGGTLAVEPWHFSGAPGN